MGGKSDTIGTPRFLYNVYFRLFERGKRVPVPIVRLMEPLGWDKKINKEEDEVTVTKETKKIKQITGQASIKMYCTRTPSTRAVWPGAWKEIACHTRPDQDKFKDRDKKMITANPTLPVKKLTKTVARETKKIKQIPGQASMKTYCTNTPSTRTVGHANRKELACQSEPSNRDMSKNKDKMITIHPTRHVDSKKRKMKTVTEKDKRKKMTKTMAERDENSKNIARQTNIKKFLVKTNTDHMDLLDYNRQRKEESTEDGQDRNSGSNKGAVTQNPNARPLGSVTSKKGTKMPSSKGKRQKELIKGQSSIMQFAKKK